MAWLRTQKFIKALTWYHANSPSVSLLGKIRNKYQNLDYSSLKSLNDYLYGNSIKLEFSRKKTGISAFVILSSESL